MPRTRPEETRDEGKKKKNGVCSNSREYTTNVFVVLYYRVYADMARRLHTIIIRGVGWAFEQNGVARILWRLCLYSVPVGFVVPLF